MTNAELVGRLGAIADRLPPVAGALMQRACGDREEHPENCNCYTCRAFIATHAAINELEQLTRALAERSDAGVYRYSDTPVASDSSREGSDVPG